jgi:hypothetical protein
MTPQQIEKTIKAACSAASKPGLALSVVAAASQQGSIGLPKEIESAVNQAIRYATQ